ncbi:uncharacterized protein LOC109859740 [Pseudomyrmex gracilis]|uniref:uncharacterized protein LOC109859740 n=1 Tax=Pseudomyrmex gracilis TaxID=219809 RepID=UPI000995704E|nr:uncharacterized protein LOC109859740 [Pseudomyrmex gracilis]
MPAESSIYWSSDDSRKSTSGSSGSGGTGGRHYIDPWDLENYAYLRRHSVADVPRRTQRCPSMQERSLRDARARSEYCCASSSLREYDERDLYHGPVRQPNNSRCYQQAIYEDEGMNYVASAPEPFPVFTPVLEIPRSLPQERKSLPHAVNAHDNRYMVQTTSPSHMDLNTYGHLKIDYTNSWNSLNRRISK